MRAGCVQLEPEHWSAVHGLPSSVHVPPAGEPEHEPVALQRSGDVHSFPSSHSDPLRMAPLHVASAAQRSGPVH